MSIRLLVRVGPRRIIPDPALGSLYTLPGSSFLCPWYSGSLSLPSGFIPLQPSVRNLNCNTSSPILVQHYHLVVSYRMYSCHHVSVFAHLHSERTLAAECVATACIIVMWVPDTIAVCITFNPPSSSQFYFAWQVYALSQKPFMKYAVSGAVAFLSLLSFGECITREQPLSADVLYLIAGGLGKSEVVNGPRLCTDVWLLLGCSVVMFTHASEILTTRHRIFNVKLIIKTSTMRDG